MGVDKESRPSLGILKPLVCVDVFMLGFGRSTPGSLFSSTASSAGFAHSRTFTPMDDLYLLLFAMHVIVKYSRILGQPP